MILNVNHCNDIPYKGSVALGTPAGVTSTQGAKLHNDGLRWTAELFVAGYTLVIKISAVKCTLDMSLSVFAAIKLQCYWVISIDFHQNFFEGRERIALVIKLIFTRIIMLLYDVNMPRNLPFILKTRLFVLTHCTWWQWLFCLYCTLVIYLQWRCDVTFSVQDLWNQVRFIAEERPSFMTNVISPSAKNEHDINRVMLMLYRF